MRTLGRVQLEEIARRMPHAFMLTSMVWGGRDRAQRYGVLVLRLEHC